MFLRGPLSNHNYCISLFLQVKGGIRAWLQPGFSCLTFGNATITIVRSPVSSGLNWKFLGVMNKLQIGRGGEEDARERLYCWNQGLIKILVCVGGANLGIAGERGI